MDPRRELARGLGPVLLTVLVIAALVGMLEGKEFVEGDTGKGEKVESGEGREGREWRVEDRVAAGASVAMLLVAAIVGYATVRTMREQKRLGERQIEWEKKYEGRRERLSMGERRYKVLCRMADLLIKSRLGGGDYQADMLRFAVESEVKSKWLFDEEEQKVVDEFWKEAVELGKVVEKLGETRAESGEKGDLRESGKEISVRMARMMQKLARRC